MNNLEKKAKNNEQSWSNYSASTPEFACFLFKQNRYARYFSSYARPLKTLHCV